MNYDVIIVGAGTAGLMAAAQLANYNIDYLVLEKNEKAGKKLLITGNKRCNIANNLSVEDFVEALTLKNKKFLYSALYQFGKDEIFKFFRERGLEFILENNFKYFPETNKSSSVLDALMKSIENGKIAYNSAVKSIDYQDDDYILKTVDKTYKAKNVIIATGSASFPSTGSSGDGVKFAESLGVKSIPFTPAETHIFSKDISQNFSTLQGIALKNIDVCIQNTKIKYSGDLLFTHFGLSGPVIYHMSEFVFEEHKKGNNILSVNLCNYSETDLREYFINSRNEGLTLRKALNQLFPKRLTECIISKCSVEKVKLNEIGKKEMNKLINFIISFPVVVDNVETREKSYVNKGGVLAKELNPKTMESKKRKGLYFIGETVDIHGPIGGFNITIAFATAYIAVQSIVMSNKK